MSKYVSRYVLCDQSAKTPAKPNYRLVGDLYGMQGANTSRQLGSIIIFDHHAYYFEL